MKMSHYANGVDRSGNLLFDIIIRGEVPDLGVIKQVNLAPYQEDYIQTGPGGCLLFCILFYRLLFG